MNMSAPTTTILIVDDEISNINVLIDLLQNQFRTLVAKSGTCALKIMQTDPQPDLVLLDIMMPNMDGFEVCQRLQADPKTAEIPIIFITGKESAQDETKGLELGAVDFIRKPFSPPVVLARIQIHLALQQQKIDLIQLNTLKNRFLGMAAHDLRSPLNSIYGYSDILLTMSLPEMEKRQYIQTIHDASHQMLNLINDLLDISVIESGHFNLRSTLANLAELVAARLQLIRLTADKKGVQIITDLQSTPLISFDVDRMAQVIDNLISNAIKFTPSDSTITLLTGQEGERVFFQVIDQGKGIPDTERHRLFMAFQKLSIRPTANEKSTGLGLSIVKNIMDAHQGEITVVNGSEQGAIFTCYLPCK